MVRWIILPFLALLPVVSMARPARGEITADQVREMIDGARKYLKASQSRVDGGWAEYPGQPGGKTALVVLALLSAGEDPKSESIQRALQYLAARGKPEKVYATSLITMAFCASDPQKYNLSIAGNVKWLESVQVKQGEERGAWGYPGSGDRSNTQFALLALHEAERAGIAVDPSTWRLALDYWIRHQREDGGWLYSPGRGASSSGSMTCAAIASILICAEKLQRGGAEIVDDRVVCCGASQENQVLENAFRWLGRKFTAVNNPGNEGSWLLYYLYAVERVGRLSGRRFIGKHDWYREGSEYLRSIMDGNRFAWTGLGPIESTDAVISTSFALLFLSKGRRPIVVAKLKYADTNEWDLHQRGIPNLTYRIEQFWKRDLSWQTIDARHATTAELLESPVLFISGREPLKLSRDQKENLRQYVNQGGFLFVEACHGEGCQGEAFDQSFRSLMEELFPQSKLRLLPPDHSIWYAESKVDPRHMRPLYGIDACCRTGVVYSPGNLSCYWELDRQRRGAAVPAEITAEIDSVIKIGANVITYATNRELKEKLDRPRIAHSTSSDRLTRGALKIPKLNHAGGSDDAPNALANLLQSLTQQTQLATSPDSELLSPGDSKLYDYPIVFMHGRRKFSFTPPERKALAAYLERGGFLFADAICASEAFADACRSELQLILPSAKWKRIPTNHPLFTAEFHGFDLPQVTLRDPQIRAENGPLTARMTTIQPFFEGLEIDGRIVAVLSPYDLSCALENHASLECKGYTKQDAVRLGINLLLYALQR